MHKDLFLTYRESKPRLQRRPGAPEKRGSREWNIPTPGQPGLHLGLAKGRAVGSLNQVLGSLKSGSATQGLLIPTPPVNLSFLGGSSPPTVEAFPSELSALCGCTTFPESHLVPTSPSPFPGIWEPFLSCCRGPIAAAELWQPRSCCSLKCPEW